MDENRLNKMREKARQMCAEKNIAILPYGNAHWLKGHGVDVIVARLDDLGASDLVPAYASLSKTYRIASKATPEGKV